VINLGRKGHHDRGSDTLLDQETNLALGVKLGAEGGHPEVILDTNGGGSLLRDATAERTALARDEGQRHVNTGLHPFGDSAPVGSGESALSLELGGGNPVVRLVARAKREGGLGRLGKNTTLPYGLETKTELGSYGLHITTDVDAGETTVEIRGVQHLKRGSEVIAGILVLDLGHIVSIVGELELGLADELIGPSEVETARQGPFVIELGLKEDLEARES